MRKIYEYEKPDGLGHRIEVVIYDDVLIRIESDWAGDSETGFGESCSICLPMDEAKKLARFISDVCT